MNKTELIAAAAEAAGITKAQAKVAVEGALNAIAADLKAGNKAAILGFGTFSVTERPERQGINPATKETITIAAKKVIKFKAGKELAESI